MKNFFEISNTQATFAELIVSDNEDDNDYNYNGDDDDKLMWNKYLIQLGRPVFYKVPHNNMY